MKLAAVLVISTVVGFALGAGAIEGLHAQSSAKPALVIAEVDVTGPPAFQAYAAKVPETLTPYHGRTIVRGRPLAKEGEPPKNSIVVITFPSLDDAEKWYGTSPYKDLIAEREKSAKTRLYIVEALPQ